jgi:hypothetical protein
MIQKKAPFSGMFTPQVSNGDCVLSRQLIGTILFGDEFRQLANGSGEVVTVLEQQLVNAGDLICEIDDGSVKCMAVNNALLSERLAKRIGVSHKKKKKAIKKTAGKPAKKPIRSSSKKAAKQTIRKTASKANRKRAQKTTKKAAKKVTKKAVKKIIAKAGKKK